jgi:hypothetical protein
MADEGQLSPRAERLVRNETLFRQVNERLKELGETFSVVVDKADFICECSNEACTEHIALTLEQYEGVRADHTHFVLVKGHEVPGIESVAYELSDRLVVVHKTQEELAEAAAAADERTN